MPQQPADIVEALNLVMRSGRGARDAIALADLAGFIKSRADVEGPVTISNTGGNTGVGASSGILTFTADYADTDGPARRDLVLRYVPGQQGIFFEYDMKRQYRVQHVLHANGLPVAQPLWLDADGAWLGRPGFVMTRVAGSAPNPAAFASGPIAEASDAGREALLDSVFATMVRLHGLNYRDAGLADFEMNAQGGSPMAKAVNWYWRTWEWIDVPVYQRLVPIHRWLLDNAPIGHECLTHGDSTLQNYMFRGSNLVAVLDWEMSCIGRAEADIALQCITNEMFAPPQGRGLRPPPSQAEWIERYQRAGGRQLDDLSYFRKFAAFINVVAVESIRRKMSVEERAANTAFAEMSWEFAER